MIIIIIFTIFIMGIVTDIYSVLICGRHNSSFFFLCLLKLPTSQWSTYFYFHPCFICEEKVTERLISFLKVLYSKEMVGQALKLKHLDALAKGSAALLPTYQHFAVEEIPVSA